jgi:hypothetical protein
MEHIRVHQALQERNQPVRVFAFGLPSRPELRGAVMTEGEMELTIERLKERLDTLETLHESRRKVRLRLGTLSIFAAIGFFVAGFVLASADLLHGQPKPSPEILFIFFMIVPLALLAFGLWAEAQ